MPNLILRAIGSLYQVGRGLFTVGKHTFRQPITKEFPDIMPDLPGRFRGRLALAVNPETSSTSVYLACNASAFARLSAFRSLPTRARRQTNLN